MTYLHTAFRYVSATSDLLILANKMKAKCRFPVAILLSLYVLPTYF